MRLQKLYDHTVAKNPGEPEFHQAVKEFFISIEPALVQHPEIERNSVLERIVEPERQIMFRVPWIDDEGKIQVNRGFRVQFNSAIGPYKGGLRFHPNVYLGIIKFLGFEQIFKNSLTGLAMGGAKGGSDFDPKGKSDREVMNFCHSFMAELYRHIGPDTDVPAGDIGVGGREIGYMFGQYKKITNRFEGVLTGKALEWGGSFIRPEATGYGATIFLEEMLKARKNPTTLKGKTVAVSGSGNVAQYAIERVTYMGGKVVSVSDSDGYVYIPDGINKEQLDYIKTLKEVRRGRIKEFADEYKLDFFAKKRPWELKVDVAFPCATQNEINGNDAKMLVDNGCIAVSEGANMPSNLEAIEIFLKNGVSLGPAKAANAGGVAVSGLEMSQNAIRLIWEWEDVLKRLEEIMVSIHKRSYEASVKYGDPGNYVMGANIAGFMKVARAMMAQGKW
jgi:glutamate dehydrogenase (NADP+)